VTLRGGRAPASAPAGWGRQVLLVARKDLRRVRGLLLLHSALVGTILMAPFLPGASGILQHLPFTPVLIVLGMVVTARCIQEDPPRRSRAFWAAHPLVPSAVLSAKAVVIGGALLAVALLGQLVGLLLYGISVGEALPLLGGSGAIYALWLLAGAVLATPFRGLAGAAAAGITGLVAAYALTGALWVGLLSIGWVPGGGESAPWVGPIGALLLGGSAYLLLLRMYLAGEDSLRWRLAGTGTLAAAVVVIGMGALSAVPREARPAPLPASAAPLPDARLDGLGVEVVQARRQPSGELQIRLEVTEAEGGASNGRLRLGGVHLVHPDGTAEKLEMRLSLDGQGSMAPVSAAGTWPGGAPAERWEGVMVRLSPSETQWEGAGAPRSGWRHGWRPSAPDASEPWAFDPVRVSPLQGPGSGSTVSRGKGPGFGSASPPPRSAGRRRSSASSLVRSARRASWGSPSSRGRATKGSL
jgi:hypothetical protein